VDFYCTDFFVLNKIVQNICLCILLWAVKHLGRQMQKALL